MRNVRLLTHQFRYELIEFLQNPQSRMFTLALPILMLAILIAILGGHRAQGHTGIVTLRQYYVPAMLAFGVVWASVINLAVTVTVSRERGVLKRRRATPVPAGVFIAARALTALILSLAVAAALVAFGAVAYGVDVGAGRIPALIAAVMVGSVSFCCLGYALVSLIASEDAALPVTLGVALPLFFISGVFIEYAGIPSSLRTVAGLFPVRHLAAALMVPFENGAHGGSPAVGDLAVVALWGLAGLAFASRRFSWEPRAA